MLDESFAIGLFEDRKLIMRRGQIAKESIPPDFFRIFTCKKKKQSTKTEQSLIDLIEKKRKKSNVNARGAYLERKSY